MTAQTPPGGTPSTFVIAPVPVSRPQGSAAATSMGTSAGITTSDLMGTIASVANDDCWKNADEISLPRHLIGLLPSCLQPSKLSAQLDSHSHSRSLRHALHCPQLGYETATRSPTLTSPRGPQTSRTTPTASCPSTAGSGTMPKASASVRHIPLASTRIRASPG